MYVEHFLVKYFFQMNRKDTHQSHNSGFLPKTEGMVINTKVDPAKTVMFHYFYLKTKQRNRTNFYLSLVNSD